MARERARNTLQTTALIHEAYLRLVDAHQSTGKTGALLRHLLHRMRRILVEFARARGRHKRGAGARNVTFDDAPSLRPGRVRTWFPWMRRSRPLPRSNPGRRK